MNEHRIYRFDFYHYIIATDCSTILPSVDYDLNTIWRDEVLI